SVPLDSPKVRAIGHGVDVDAFPCTERQSGARLRLLGLGRYAPVKGWDIALRALAQLPEAGLAIHGAVLTAADRRNRAELERLAAARCATRSSLGTQSSTGPRPCSRPLRERLYTGPACASRSSSSSRTASTGRSVRRRRRSAP